MDVDQLILMGAICAAVYVTGYTSLAIGIFLLVFISNVILGNNAPKKPKGVSTAGVRVKGAEMLEPIVIETTRGAPFRIPSNMHVRVKSNWGGNTWYEKAMGKGLGKMARLAYRPLSGLDYGD